ncbi:hypothetical protein [Coprococcus comes]|uniref:hypothetical protein n=1 Tax=Coprococcus comes TaxID=410072 RepID=UPI001896BFFA|nr:hypothetical protein [Coprococcus comes]
MDNEKTLESVPSATQEKIKVESINVIVEEIGGKPYYELRYRVVGDDFCHIGYGSYCLDYVPDWKKQYFEVVPHETKQRKEMKWIPTIERLPDQREFIESYVRSAYAAEFLVTIEGADKATTLYYSQTGVWFDEQGEPYKVVAWMPLPERYKG